MPREYMNRICCIAAPGAASRDRGTDALEHRLIYDDPIRIEEAVSFPPGLFEYLASLVTGKQERLTEE